MTLANRFGDMLLIRGTPITWVDPWNNRKDGVVAGPIIDDRIAVTDKDQVVSIKLSEIVDVRVKTDRISVKDIDKAVSITGRGIPDGETGLIAVSKSESALIRKATGPPAHEIAEAAPAQEPAADPTWAMFAQQAGQTAAARGLHNRVELNLPEAMPRKPCCPAILGAPYDEKPTTVGATPYQPGIGTGGVGPETVTGAAPGAAAYYRDMARQAQPSWFTRLWRWLSFRA
jgi:hypothetical protein